MYLCVLCTIIINSTLLKAEDSVRYYKNEICKAEKNVYLANSIVEKNSSLLKKYTLLKKIGDYNEALTTIMRADFYSENDSINFIICYEGAWLNLLLEKYPDAEYYLALIDFEKLTPQHKINCLEIRLLNNIGLQKLKEAKSDFKILYNKPNADELFDKLAKKHKLLSEKKAEYLSMFFPGLGLVYAKKAGAGVVSFIAVTGGLTWLAYKIYTGYYLTAFLSCGNTTQLFYFGGVKYAIKTVQKQNKKSVARFQIACLNQ